MVSSTRIDDDHIRLDKDFSIIDNRGRQWTAKAGYVSDGATLKMFKGVPGIGHPLDGDYLEASIIHDFYCDNQERTQKETHRVFRECLEADKVKGIKAYLMWFAVRVYNRIKNGDWK